MPSQSAEWKRLEEQARSLASGRVGTRESALPPRSGAGGASRRKSVNASRPGQPAPLSARKRTVSAVSDMEGHADGDSTDGDGAGSQDSLSPSSKRRRTEEENSPTAAAAAAAPVEAETPSPEPVAAAGPPMVVPKPAVAAIPARSVMIPSAQQAMAATPVPPARVPSPATPADRLQEENDKLKFLLRERDRKLQYLVPSLKLFEMNNILDMITHGNSMNGAQPSIDLLLGKMQSHLEEAVSLLSETEERSSALSISRAMMTQLTQWIVGNFSDLEKLGVDTPEEDDDGASAQTPEAVRPVRPTMVNMLDELANHFKDLFDEPDVSRLLIRRSGEEESQWDGAHMIRFLRAWSSSLWRIAPSAAEVFGELSDKLREEGFSSPSGT
jgi:hypothetical protein